MLSEFSVYSEFPNFMNNFLTIRSIRPWDPVPRRVAESPSGVQPTLAQIKRQGALYERHGCGQPEPAA